MALTPVEAVIFWRYITAPFKAVYGRFPTPGGYTKNYLQTSGTAKVVLDRVLRRPEDGQVEFTWRWPGGTLTADWKEKVVEGDSRGELDIRVGANTVAPFQLGNPDSEIFATIPGDRTKGTAEDADAELEALKAANLDPWLVAVKLRGEENVLHARAYLGNPSPELEARGVSGLPSSVRQAIQNHPANQSAGAIVLSTTPAARAPTLMAKIKAALARDPNVLLVGPPGTGKTVALEDLRAEYESEILFDPAFWEDNWREGQGTESTRRALSLVFHPSYAYENFVAGLTPAAGVGITLEPKPGPLVSLAHWAAGNEREALLVIDEFNRGPAAAIFGDTLALLDVEKRSSGTSPGAAITRPFSDRAMKVTDDFRQAGGNVDVPTALTLPLGLKIVAAMNSTDRSVAPLDAALRRRFAILRVDPDYSVLAQRLSISIPDFSAAFAPASWDQAAVKELAVRLLETMNSRIDLILGPDFLLGHALFWGVSGNDRDQLANALVSAFEERVLASLRLTFTDQDEALAAVLGVSENTEGSVAYWKTPPTALAGVAGPRLEFADLPALAGVEARLEALRAILRS